MKETVTSDLLYRGDWFLQYAQASSLQKANSGSNWRLSSKQVGVSEYSFVCHVPGTRGISPGYAPAGHRLNVFLRRRHRLSSFLLLKDGSRGCNAVGCANTNNHRPTNTRSFFSAPEAALNEVERIFDCV